MFRKGYVANSVLIIFCRFGKKGSSKKGFHKMTDASKKKFMNAIFGELSTSAADDIEQFSSTMISVLLMMMRRWRRFMLIMMTMVILMIMAMISSSRQVRRAPR